MKLQRNCQFYFDVEFYVDEDVSSCLNTDQCDCADSSFCDPH